jgi:hypothetical protein
LADRIRDLVAGEDGVAEQLMYGGLAFLINGNMSVAASGQGGLLVRVDSRTGMARLSGLRLMIPQAKPSMQSLVELAERVESGSHPVVDRQTFALEDVP